MKAILGLLLSFSLVSCQNIKYTDDIGFLSSASANSPEFFAYIGDRPCKDMDGLTGMCSKRLKRNQALVIKAPPRSYDWRAYFDCTNSVQGQPEVRVVQRGAEATFTIPPSSYGLERAFSCSLMATPMDRPEPIAAFARVTVSLIDEDYQFLDRPTPQQGGIIFGTHAYYVMYLTDAGWKYATETTVLHREKVHKAFVESYVMRGSSYGF